LYKALSAEAKTKFGLSPVLIVHDELGQVKGPRHKLYEALETATAAQASPLSLIISTQAPTDGDLLSILIDDGLTGADPRTVVSLYTAPLDADPFDEATVKLANPGYGVLQNPAEVMAMANDAKRMPSREAEYRNLVLNQRVEVNAPFVTRTVWQACDQAVATLGNEHVYLGFDLSEVNDLTCMVLLWYAQERWQVRPYFWLPEDGIKERSKADRVPYDLWAEQGHIELCPGSAVSYEWVAKRVAGILKSVQFKAAGFDSWNWRHFEPWLKKAKVKASVLAKFQPVRMGSQSMSPALRTLETDILQRELAHGGHPVLSMCVSNARVTKDSAGNRRLDKQVSRGRIDGAVALAIARAVAAEHHRDSSGAGIKLI
jgi:phage terminase large subunit-like protein